MFKKIIIALSSITLLSLSITNVVLADEYLTVEQINKVTHGLSEDEFVLPTPEGGIIMNIDGSNNFSPDQLSEFGASMTVSEFKDYLGNLDISSLEIPNNNSSFRAAYAPSQIRVLYANQIYRSNPFSAKGWRYGELKFKPSFGTGDFLFWQPFGDSGVVEDGRGVSVSIYPGNNVSVYSKYGTYFKTYNPVPGSIYQVTNPV